MVPEVPDADAAEQQEPAEGELTAHRPGAADAPEADVLEQSRPVDGGATAAAARRGAPGVDASEADWLEQSVAEPIDEDEIR